MTPQKQMSLRSCHNKQESAQSRLVLEVVVVVVVVVVVAVVLVAGGGGCAAPKSEGQDLSAMWRPRPAHLDPGAGARAPHLPEVGWAKGPGMVHMTALPLAAASPRRSLGGPAPGACAARPMGARWGAPRRRAGLNSRAG